MKNFKTLVGRSSTLSPMTNDRAEILHHYQVKLNLKGLFLGRDSHAITYENFIQNRIDNYSAKVGYPTTIEVSEVMDYFLKSAEAFGWLRSVLRRGNVQNLRNNQGIVIGDVLTPRYVNYTFSSAIAAIKNGSNPLLEDDDKIFRLSNSAWAELVGKVSSVAIAPMSWLMQLSYFLDPYFSNNLNSQEGHSDLISMDLDTVGISDIIKHINDLTSELTALSNAEPFLLSFFQTEFDNLMGIHQFDFTRDLAKQTLVIVNDDELIGKLNTTLAAAVRLSSNDYVSPIILDSELYRDYSLEYSALEYPAVDNIPVEKLTYMMLVDSIDETATLRLEPTLTALTKDVNGTSIVTHEFHLHPGNFEGEASPEIGWLRGLTRAFEKYPLFTPFDVQYYMTSATDIGHPLVELKANPNLLLFNEDAVNEARIDFKLEQLFGTEMYMNKPVNPYVGLGLADNFDIKMDRNPVKKENAKKDKNKPKNKDSKS